MSTQVSTKKPKNQFLRVYVKESRSPWEDSSTILLLADIVSADAKENILLGFERFVYLHRSADGRCTGLSISKRLMDDNPDINVRYLEGQQMKKFLLLYLSEIIAFCEHFESEFVSVFMQSPAIFFKTLKKQWRQSKSCSL